jgi:hypothetical protein
MGPDVGRDVGPDVRPKVIPEWKRKEKRHESEERRRKEEQSWEGMPLWKRKLLEKKSSNGQQPLSLNIAEHKFEEEEEAKTVYGGPLPHDLLSSKLLGDCGRRHASSGGAGADARRGTGAAGNRLSGAGAEGATTGATATTRRRHRKGEGGVRHPYNANQKASLGREFKISNKIERPRRIALAEEITDKHKRPKRFSKIL